MSDFVSTMNEKMCFSFTVKQLWDILDEMLDEGYGDANVAFRIGHTPDNPPLAICFPIADIRVLMDSDAKPQSVLFTSAPGINSIDNVRLPEFDLVASINDDSISLKFEDLKKE